MSRLRDLLDDEQFKAIVRDIEAEARKIGFKPAGGSYVAPVPKHSKLRRNRCVSRAGHRNGKVRTEVVPGFGPRRYRIKQLSETSPLENGYTRISRGQRLVWDPSTRPRPVLGLHNCTYSGCKGCAKA